VIEKSDTSKTLRARELGVSRQSLYYKPKIPDRDWKLKCQIELVLREHPSYGSPRIALFLKRNHKPIERVMQKFGIKAYRRRGKKYQKREKSSLSTQTCFFWNLHNMKIISGYQTSLTGIF
jgi:hypothetical protein